jgi:hypothetical protein
MQLCLCLWLKISGNMAFRSGQNYFKSIRNIQTSYKHVITLNIMLKISRWSSNSKKK